MSENPADPANRQTYLGSGLDQLDTRQPVVAPLEVLRQWWADAVADQRVYEPAAMSLATVDHAGLPNVRTVLLRDLDPQGITFYTNLTSAKAGELAGGQAAASFSWHAMFRQIRLRGQVEQVSRAAAQAYWDTRPRGSQVASSASHQSRPVQSRESLERAVDALSQSLEGAPVPLPDTWGGYRLRPVEIECWVGLPSRLHDRIRWWSQDGPHPLDDPAGWHWTRLQP